MIYLILNNILFEWMIYQKIPFLIKDSFNYSFIDLINEYIYFIFFNPIFNLVHEPQWLVYSILFIFNIISGYILLLKYLLKKLQLKKLKFFLLYYLFFLLTFLLKLKRLCIYPVL